MGNSILGSNQKGFGLGMSYPNRFKGLKYINVNALRTSFLIGCVFNIVLAVVLLSVVGAFVFFVSSSEAQQGQEISTASNRPTVAFLPTLTPFPTATRGITFTVSAPTPFPTSTPNPTFTPFPTLTPFPTSTPFSFTLVISQPLPMPTATRLYNLGELLGGAPLPSLYSQYKYAFYRAICLPGLPRIEPRVIGLPEIIQGLHWRLWNDFGYVADTSDFETAYSDDTTLFLSSDPSLFKLALFYFDQQISDQVLIDYPGSCGAAQVIYGRASRSDGGSVLLPGSVISQTEVISVSVSQ